MKRLNERPPMILAALAMIAMVAGAYLIFDTLQYQINQW